MKRWYVVLGMLVMAVAALPLRAQEPGELAWQWHAEPVAGAEGEVELVASSTIQPGWVVYASDFTPGDFGPRPARVVVNGGGEALAPARSIGAQAGSGPDAAGQSRYTYFTGAATFRQRVRVAPGAQQVTGVLAGQSCQEASGLCTLFRAPFAVALD